MNLFISNLSANTTEKELNTLFAHYGAVTEVKVVRDDETHQSRGFGFVELAEEAAAAARANLNGALLDGRIIRVAEARSEEEWGGNNQHTTGGGIYTSANNVDEDIY